jgi:hypothetical protein
VAEKAFPVQLSKLEGLGSVTMCGCGVVSLNIAGITLRLEASAFNQFEQMVGTAARALQAQQAASSIDSRSGSAMIQ